MPIGADLVRFKAEVHFDGMELTRLHMKTINLEKSLEVGIHTTYPIQAKFKCIERLDTSKQFNYLSLY